MVHWFLQHPGVMRHSWVDVTSVNAHEDKIFGRQNIIHFFLDVAKDYKYAKSPRAENLTDCG